MNGRAFIKISKDLKLVPVALLGFASSGRDNDPGFTGSTVQKTDYGTFNLGLGVGTNYQVDEKNLVVIGLEILGIDRTTQDLKDVQKTTNSTTIFPGIYVGGETQVWNWLVFI